MILLDSNAVITLFQGSGQRRAYGNYSTTSTKYAISIISYIELLSIRDPQIATSMRKFLSALHIVQLTEDIVEKSIDVRIQFSIKTVDAIIAATALKLNVPLVSLDFVFKKIHGLRLITSI